jgi:hypothetical protein
MLIYRRGDRIIGVTGERDRFRGIELLGAGRGQRQHLKVDAGCVHRGNAFVADVARRFDQLDGAARFFQVLTGALDKQRGSKMLFQSDDAHAWTFPLSRYENCTSCGVAVILRWPRSDPRRMTARAVALRGSLPLAPQGDGNRRFMWFDTTPR